MLVAWVLAGWFPDREKELGYVPSVPRFSCPQVFMSPGFQVFRFSKPLSSRYDSERDVRVSYQPDDPKMRPHGFSGSAAWCDRLRRDGPVWTAHPMRFGVQTSAFMTSKLLQIVGAPTVNEFLEGSFRELGRDGFRLLFPRQQL